MQVAWEAGGEAYIMEVIKLGMLMMPPGGGGVGVQIWSKLFYSVDTLANVKTTPSLPAFECIK